MDVRSIRHAVYLTVQEFPARRGHNSVESAALVLSRAPGTVYNKADPGNDTQGFYVEEAVALMISARDYRILHALASACDHAAIPLAPFRNTSDMELLDLMAREQVAAGAKADAIRRALSDGRIDLAEMKEIAGAFHAQIRATLELLSRLEGIAGAR